MRTLDFTHGSPATVTMSDLWLIEPSVHKISSVSRSKAAARKHEKISLARPSVSQLLQPIDDFFFFSSSVSWFGGEGPSTPFPRAPIHSEQDQFNMDKLPLFTDQCVCGLQQLKLSEVKSNLPEGFSDFPDTQVIIDCTELKCQTPSSPLIQSKMYSSNKPHCTMKDPVEMVLLMVQ